MRFHAPKRYGQSKLNNCTFCGRTATQKNEAGMEVCYLHQQERLPEIKCVCGSWLEQRAGKFGPYFNCIRCGNLNFRRGLEMKAVMKEKAEPKKENILPQKERKEIVITSRDVEWFD